MPLDDRGEVGVDLAQPGDRGREGAFVEHPFTLVARLAMVSGMRSERAPLSQAPPGLIALVLLLLPR